MSDLDGYPEDRLSHDEFQLERTNKMNMFYLKIIISILVKT